jgi:hypothetical protein
MILDYRAELGRRTKQFHSHLEPMDRQDEELLRVPEAVNSSEG